MWAAVRGLLRTRIVAGVLIVVPIYITYLVVVFVFDTMRFATEPLAQWVTDEYAKNPKSPVPAFFKPYLDWLVPVVAVLLTLFLLYLLGMFAANIFGRRVIAGIERLVDRVPVAKTVYHATKQILATVAGQTEMSGRRVVLVEFFRPGMKSVGILTSILKDADTGRALCAVFIPTTPNPAVGYTQVVPIEEVSMTDWTVEEAVKIVMSGGIMLPDKVAFDRIHPVLPQKGEEGNRAPSAAADGRAIRE